ncbi:hypothetical protein HELRODRAFT_166057 [Helobdella robusta]|uniref:BACK domain-containing protein n=1 Tax=Helobdella robusta TaxID=6412 RepID=T1EXN4_HELRO|nr:hypothetical protein HELRODRAFT_166057 [Helobdella robusta]ESN90392.1 hypothetical protein HELRODRAFT_166057 [Helobdella robusta]
MVDDGKIHNIPTTEGHQIIISKSGGRHEFDRNVLCQESCYFQGLVSSGMRDAHYRELTLEYLTNESLLEVNDYLSRKMSKSSEMLSILPDDMFRLVGSEDINANSEIDIFNLIIKWISADLLRKHYAEKLLHEVRFSLMTATEKKKCVSLLDDLNLNICHSKEKDANVFHTVGMLVAVGLTASKDEKFFNMLHLFDLVDAFKSSAHPSKSSLLKFKFYGRKGPPVDLIECNARVVDNCLYLVGGKTPNHENINDVFVYNPVLATWSKCCSMHLARSSFYLGEIAGHLYAVSGHIAFLFGTPTVEKYIPSENQWYMVEPLPDALVCSAGCAFNGMMYVSGGFDEYGLVDLVWQFDPSYNKWFSIAQCGHVMTCTGNNLFVVGGGTSEMSQWSINIMNGEMYDFENDQWSTVLKLKMFVHCSPYITINNCIYIFQQKPLLDNMSDTHLQKINLTKYLGGKNTSDESNLSSVPDENANKNFWLNEAEE